MVIPASRFVSKVARELRRDGFVRMASDLLYHDDSGGVAVINVQRATGWGAPLTFYVNVATGPAAYFESVEPALVRDEPARGGFGMWRSRVLPPVPELRRFPLGDAVHDMWACHDDEDVELAAREFVAVARAKVVPTLCGLLDPSIALRAVRRRVPGYTLAMRHEAAEALLVRLAGSDAAADASPATWFIDERDPDDDSFADEPGATLREGAVIDADGAASPCMVLDRGHTLTVQLPGPAAEVFVGGRTIAEVAQGIGWGRPSPQPQFFKGDPERVWIQDSRGDAVLVVARSDRPDDRVFVRLGPLNAADAAASPAEVGWAVVAVVRSDDYLPAARRGDYTALVNDGLVWAGSVTTTTRTA